MFICAPEVAIFEQFSKTVIPVQRQTLFFVIDWTIWMVKKIK